MKMDAKGPVTVACPFCGAEAGAWCKSGGKPLFPVHKARKRAFHSPGEEPVPPKPGTKGWDRVVARGCGGYVNDTPNGRDYDCSHWPWACDDCPVCIDSQTREYEMLNAVSQFPGPPRPPDPFSYDFFVIERTPSVATEIE